MLRVQGLGFRIPLYCPLLPRTIYPTLLGGGVIRPACLVSSIYIVRDPKKDIGCRGLGKSRITKGNFSLIEGGT